MPSSGGSGFLSGHNPFEFSANNPLVTFILQMIIIVVACRVIKLILMPLRQPSVIAEIIAGILLGPTAMGRIPGYMDAIFKKESLPFLNLMSNFGLVIFLFLVGLELDPKMISKSFRKSLTISLAGMIVPFTLGAAVSYLLYNLIEPEANTTPFSTYLLFLGTAMSITAFPVLARILTELNLLTTKAGSVTIAAAALDDATSWCLLALVVSIVNAGSELNILWIFLMGLGYGLFLGLLVRPALIYVCRRSGAFENGPSQSIVLLCLIILFSSAFIADAIGIDAIFGGFLAGTIMPHENGFARHLTEKLEDVVHAVFLPLYFTLSGLKTQLGILDDSISWMMVMLVIFVACVGKISGCTIAAKLSKMSWRESLTIGIMMNCKGLVELIVLNLGLDTGVISQKTFSIMVIMALFTTFLTVPLLSVVYIKPSCSIAKKFDETTNSLKLVVCLAKLGHLPALIALVQLLPISQLEITALRLIELTERRSTIMLHAESSGNIGMDPILNVFHSFAQATAAGSQAILKIILLQDFFTTISTISQQSNSELIIIPWNCSHMSIDNTSNSPLDSSLSTSYQINNSTSKQHASVVRELFEKAPCRVAVLVDRGLGDIAFQNATGSSNNIRNIFMPFLGGKDDRAALKLLMSLASEKVKITLVRYLNQNVDLEKSTNPQESQYVRASGHTFLKSHDQDELALDYYLNSSKNNQSDSIHYKINYVEVKTNQPILAAIEFVSSFNKTDLIIVGRGDSSSPTLFHSPNGKRPDNNRRMILGNTTESILLSLTLASVLVVQEHTD